MARLKRRTVLGLFGATGGSLALPAAAQARPGRGEPSPVYLGAYTGGDPGRGIGVASAEPRTGALRLDTVVPSAEPSFLALSGDRSVLYAVNETPNGAVSAFALRADGGVGELLGTGGSGGDHPCHLALHPGGRHLFTANYTSGTVAVLPLRDDGAPGDPVQVVQHTGSGPHPRQDGPHAHMVLPDPAGDRLFAVDLGTDTVYVYGFDPAAGRLTGGAEARMAPGSGPRHLALHPGGRTAYVLGELDSTLTGCAYDPGSGTLTPLGTVSTLPDGTPPDGNTGAEVLVSADGRFVYASNRGHDSIAVFAVEGEDGTTLRPVGHHACGGRSPRHIAFGPGGRHLYVANQLSGDVAVFHRDPAGGGLSPAGDPLSYPEAVCVLPVRG